MSSPTRRLGRFLSLPRQVTPPCGFDGAMRQRATRYSPASPVVAATSPLIEARRWSR
jgi:hypothetical protein